ncbi:MAG TPA: hypothetical protein VLG12_07275 [Candidatus Saccharimonadales bacterium]|nr:hypothetical protein [Candidatus Saccharimonadales bacterium]
MATLKLYCYVDESGQNTLGQTFIVSIIVIDQERDELLTLCEQIEKISGKNKDKWGEAAHDRRMRYLRHIFADDRVRSCLRYAIFHQTTKYDTATIKGIVAAIKWKKPKDKFTTLVYVDGLAKTKRHEYAVKLRHFGIPVKKVQGIARDETNALTRLADAVAGFILDVLEDKSPEIKNLFQRVNKEGVLIDITL